MCLILCFPLSRLSIFLSLGPLLFSSGLGHMSTFVSLSSTTDTGRSIDAAAMFQSFLFKVAFSVTVGEMTGSKGCDCFYRVSLWPPISKKTEFLRTPCALLCFWEIGGSSETIFVHQWGSHILHHCSVFWSLWKKGLFYQGDKKESFIRVLCCFLKYFVFFYFFTIFCFPDRMGPISWKVWWFSNFPE